MTALDGEVFGVCPFPAAAFGTHLVGNVGAGLLIDNAHGKFNLAAIIEAKNFDAHFVSDIDDITGFRDPALR
jgi:hypothetical protein